MRVLAVGAGVIGLRTCIQLLGKGVERLHLRARHHPLAAAVASQGAGGLWLPYRSEDRRTNRWAATTLGEYLAHAAEGATATHEQPALPVEILPVVSLKQSKEDPPPWLRDPRLEWQAKSTAAVYADHGPHSRAPLRLPLDQAAVEKAYPHCWLFRTPVVDSPRALNAMLGHVRSHPAVAEVAFGTNEQGHCTTNDSTPAVTFTTVDDMVEEARRLGCDMVLNATGLGAREMVGEEGGAGVVPGRGGLLLCPRTTSAGGAQDCVLQMTEGPWFSAPRPAYLIPRGPFLCVGGSYDEATGSATLEASERQRLEGIARTMGVPSEAVARASEWVGYRPVRSTARVELEETAADVQVVHCYGHGGSGWTVAAGVAEDAAALMLAHDSEKLC